jgi:hypothetical protein
MFTLSRSPLTQVRNFADVGADGGLGVCGLGVCGLGAGLRTFLLSGMIA